MEKLEKWTFLNFIVNALQEKGQVGHTLLQKLVYLLQSAYDVSLGYNFHLHYYGPYSENLWADINQLKNFEILEVKPDPSGAGYRITSKIRAEAPKSQELREKVDKLVNLLGNKYVKELELLSTTHYVWADLKRKHRRHSDEQVIQFVRELKPHLKRDQVMYALSKLRQEKVLPEN